MKELKVDQMAKEFKHQLLFSDVSFTLEGGKIYGLIGPNGSGKSVLFKLLCGLMRPTRGTITYNGKQLNKEIKILPSVGVIINTPTFYEYLSGYENLTLLASIKNKISDSTILEMMDKVGISYAKDKMVKKYSLGMRQRLALAQAIMEDPEVLLLDEVTNGLDKNGVEMVYQLLKEEKDKGKIILITSHNMKDIETLCDSVYEINAQRIDQV